MTREEAIRLMAVYEAVGSALNPVLNRDCIADDAEREQMHMAHGQVIWCIFEKCMVPIIRQYPDLDPDDMEEAIKTTFPKPE